MDNWLDEQYEDFEHYYYVFNEFEVLDEKHPPESLMEKFHVLRSHFEVAMRLRDTEPSPEAESFIRAGIGAGMADIQRVWASAKPRTRNNTIPHQIAEILKSKPDWSKHSDNSVASLLRSQHPDQFPNANNKQVTAARKLIN